jgi:hypothetical protein
VNLRLRPFVSLGGRVRGFSQKNIFDGLRWEHPHLQRAENSSSTTTPGCAVLLAYTQATGPMTVAKTAQPRVSVLLKAFQENL